ncbi:hypothetical protein Q9L58_001912 [Maublancomyces gigas]|uniref:Protein kinase domain-containing protein n=1 Tax=Discina gigas TaxID=1032678 RepID=A0ABR3GT00_9PEZI
MDMDMDLDSATGQRVNRYRLDVTTVTYDKTPENDIAMITHETGGDKVTEYIGSWKRESVIGSGGSGVVYLESCAAAGSVRAVKQLMTTRNEWRRREIDGMLLFPRLFVNLYCWYYCGGSMYIAMEYHHLGDISSYIFSVGALDENAARVIATQILQAVFVLHEHGFMHRDIKPENILLVSKSSMIVKLADFGGVKECKASNHTAMGTWEWAAPEQISGEYDKSVDIWSVGCVVYFLLTSLSPFRSVDNPAAAIEKYTFPFWPQLRRSTFQQSRTNRPPGDQILARGISNHANSFLNFLIVADPSQRISAHQALQHRWIADSTLSLPVHPLDQALWVGDKPLAQLLAKHDARYDETWNQLQSRSRCLVFMRAAASVGSREEINRRIKELSGMPTLMNKSSTLPVNQALLFAARRGVLPNFEMLFHGLPPADKANPILLAAIKLALLERHDAVASFLWPLVSETDRVHDHHLMLLIAGYGCTPLLRMAIRFRNDNIGGALNGIQSFMISDHDICTILDDFPKMLLLVAQLGNIDNLKLLLQSPLTKECIPGPELMLAVEANNSEIVRVLLTHYERRKGTSRWAHLQFSKALNIAAWLGHLEIVKNLEGYIGSNSAAVISAIEREYYNIILPRSNRRESVVHLLKASHIGKGEMVEWLRKEIDGTEIEGDCIAAAFLGAVKRGHASIIDYLCDRYVSVDILQEWLVEAARNGHLGILQRLLSHTPNPAAETLTAALDAAARSNRLGAVLQLLCAGARADNDVGRNLLDNCVVFIADLVRDFGFGQLGRVG